jgi:NADH-quinone oxidoreductase subunit L
LAISGVPFFAGFYSKDAILAAALAFGMENPAHYVPFVLGILAACITAFYMFRLIFLTFTGKPRDQEKYDHAHESPAVMTVPLLILAVLSIIGAGWQGPSEGWFSRFSAPYDLATITAEFDLPVAHGPELAGHSDASAEAAAHAESQGTAEPVGHETPEVADPHGAEAVTHAAAAAHGAESEAGHGETEHAATAHGEEHHDVHHLAHTRAMQLSILVAALGIFFSWLTYGARKIKAEKIQAALPFVHAFLQNGNYFDQLYNATVYRGLLAWNKLVAAFDLIVIDGIVNGAGYLYRFLSWLVGIFDNWVVDGLVNGVAAFFQGFGEIFRRVQTGRIQTYLILVCFSILVLVFVFRAL